MLLLLQYQQVSLHMVCAFLSKQTYHSNVALLLVVAAVGVKGLDHVHYHVGHILWRWVDEVVAEHLPGGTFPIVAKFTLGLAPDCQEPTSTLAS